MNQLIWITQLLFWIGLGMVLLSAVRGGRAIYAQTMIDGRVEFAPRRLALWGALSIAFCFIAFCFGYFTISHLRNHHDIGFDLLISACNGLVALTVIRSLPATITVAPDGVSQSFWLRKKKTIRWENIVEVNIGEKSKTVTITASDGTKIVHSRLFPDRPRLLIEIKQHSGENLPPGFPHEPISLA